MTSGNGNKGKKGGGAIYPPPFSFSLYKVIFTKRTQLSIRNDYDHGITETVRPTCMGTQLSGSGFQ